MKSQISRVPCVISLALAAVVSAPIAHAQSAAAPERAAPPAIALPEVDVIASTPLLGAGVDRDKVPHATTVLNADDV